MIEPYPFAWASDSRIISWLALWLSFFLRTAQSGMNRFKVLAGNQVVLITCALAGVRLSTTDKTKRSRGDRQCKSKPRCLHSIYGETDGGFNRQSNHRSESVNRLS